jgi:hypothetical protein
MTKITELERNLLRNIARNEMNTANTYVPRSHEETMCWTSLLDAGPNFVGHGSLPGVMSSLVKKGLVTGESVAFAGEDATSKLTEAGYKAYLEQWPDDAALLTAGKDMSWHKQDI